MAQNYSSVCMLFLKIAYKIGSKNPNMYIKAPMMTTIPISL